MMVKFVSIVFATIFLIAAPSGARAKQFALVIGNDTYQEVPSLNKAVNDSRTIARTLSTLGFQVSQYENVSRRDMNFHLQQFTTQLKPGDEAVFFFAGHGVEIAGRNYLLPTDIPNAEPGRESYVESEAVPVDRVLEQIRSKGTRLSLLVLDACRNNPFQSNGTRSLGGTRGLAWMPAPEGSFIMYSAGVGQEALDALSDDDPNPNSVFTRSLVPLLLEPGMSLVQTARQVRRDVQKLAATVSHEQRPAYYDEVVGDYYLSGQGAKSTPDVVATDAESVFWSSIDDSTEPAMFAAYLDQYPNGVFASLARIKLESLEETTATKIHTPQTDQRGLKTLDVQLGQGAELVPGDQLRVHYTGKLLDGTVFDSSIERGEPISFELAAYGMPGGVISGFNDGILGMRVGGKRTITIPPELGYGSRENGPIPANATLIFEIEVVGKN